MAQQKLQEMAAHGDPRGFHRPPMIRVERVLSKPSRLQDSREHPSEDGRHLVLKIMVEKSEKEGQSWGGGGGERVDEQETGQKHGGWVSDRTG